MAQKENITFEINISKCSCYGNDIKRTRSKAAGAPPTIPGALRRLFSSSQAEYNSTTRIFINPSHPIVHYHHLLNNPSRLSSLIFGVMKKLKDNLHAHAGDYTYIYCSIFNVPKQAKPENLLHIQACCAIGGTDLRDMIRNITQSLFGTSDGTKSPHTHPKSTEKCYKADKIFKTIDLHVNAVFVFV
ncbi:hypothetical protein CAPTEDRAFT_205751 [Capitella teleta]|uniref:Uncharacterized protein n=1 Tax=Capitella teleta TaxID=283909 RepID=R7THP9_CAPTE|nr:hypothetical protein CAPTEDRAFT_205751 [Capitella teleta]|eukprot:ELT93308.1 hypothetical protein CAPTEDRAFT_205751 [Capitella teleta]